MLKYAPLRTRLFSIKKPRVRYVTVIYSFPLGLPAMKVVLDSRSVSPSLTIGKLPSLLSS